jgi:Fic family protein
LTFKADLEKASPHLWVMLGECQSKCHHLSWVPLRPDVAQEMHRVYLAKGSLGSAAIEGNTLTEEQVEQMLKGELKLPKSQEYLAQEVDNIIAACNEIGDTLLKSQPPQCNVERIKDLHTRVFRDLGYEEESGLPPGAFRHESVGVGRYRGVPAEDCEYLVNRLCNWLSDLIDQDHFSVVMPILKAILAHLYLAWIHPFPDGNGRTARLIEFQILSAAGIPTPACHLLSNHYNLTRSEYYRQLDRASKSGGDVLPFIEYAVSGFQDGLKGQLEWIRRQTWDVVWRNYVHEKLGNRRGPTWDRRRHLVLDLSVHENSIPVSRLTELSPRVAREYADKTQKTLTRDLNALESLQLVQRSSKGVRARIETIRAFLPFAAQPE